MYEQSEPSLKCVFNQIRAVKYRIIMRLQCTHNRGIIPKETSENPRLECPKLSNIQCLKNLPQRSEPFSAAEEASTGSRSTGWRDRATWWKHSCLSLRWRSGNITNNIYLFIYWYFIRSQKLLSFHAIQPATEIRQRNLFVNTNVNL